MTPHWHALIATMERRGMRLAREGRVVKCFEPPVTASELASEVAAYL